LLTVHAKAAVKVVSVGDKVSLVFSSHLSFCSLKSSVTRRKIELLWCRRQHERNHNYWTLCKQKGKSLKC